MADHTEEKEKIREKIKQPENRFRGITEETGVRILYVLYQILELLQQKKSEGADSIIQNQDK